MRFWERMCKNNATISSIIIFFMATNPPLSLKMLHNLYSCVFIHNCSMQLDLWIELPCKVSNDKFTLQFSFLMVLSWHASYDSIFQQAKQNTILTKTKISLPFPHIFPCPLYYIFVECTYLFHRWYFFLSLLLFEIQTIEFI